MQNQFKQSCLYIKHGYLNVQYTIMYSFMFFSNKNKGSKLGIAKKCCQSPTQTNRKRLEE